MALTLLSLKNVQVPIHPNSTTLSDHSAPSLELSIGATKVRHGFVLKELIIKSWASEKTTELIRSRKLLFLLNFECRPREDYSVKNWRLWQYWPNTQTPNHTLKTGPLAAIYKCPSDGLSPSLTAWCSLHLKFPEEGAAFFKDLRLIIPSCSQKYPTFLIII